MARDADQNNYFLTCPKCQAPFDMRDLRQVLEHLHGGEVEIILKDSVWTPQQLLTKDEGVPIRS